MFYSVLLEHDEHRCSVSEFISIALDRILFVGYFSHSIRIFHCYYCGDGGGCLDFLVTYINNIAIAINFLTVFI